MIVHMAKNQGGKHGKKKLLLPLGVMFIAGAYVALALTQPLLSITGQATLTAKSQAAENVDLNWPEYGQAAIGAPGYGILATHGDQKPVATASVAKVMTAVAVLRQRPLHVGEQGPDIVITQEDVDSYHDFVAGDGSVVGVALGEHISEYQAIQAMLLPSANNMAVTLARWAFGSTAAYNTYANSYAKELGLSSMHITDPSGYDAKTVASAHDLTLLGTLAMLNPVFAEIVAQPSATIPVQGKISNYNFMLGENGNVGIKTGNNDGDQGAFLFASKQKIGNQTVTLVGIIMDGPDLASVLRDSGALTTSALAGFKDTTFISAGDKVGSYTIPGQGSVDAVANDTLQFPVWRGLSSMSAVTLNPIKHAGSQTSVGSFTVTNTTTHLSSSVPVRLKSATRTPGIIWRLTHPFGT
jgi:D-alanyl-D-alanine carboxypeptidase (penicillin-binding protein 5/6)